MYKSSDLNTIPYKILNLLKQDISKQLADLFNISFIWCLSTITQNSKVSQGVRQERKKFWVLDELGNKMQLRV